MKHQLPAAMLLLTSLWSCGESPSPRVVAPTPVTVRPPTVQALQITAPATLDIGHTFQLSAVTVFSDGTTQPLGASDVTWQSSNLVVASVSSTGVLSALQAGTVDVRGTYQQWTSLPASVLVGTALGTFEDPSPWD